MPADKRIAPVAADAPLGDRQLDALQRHAGGIGHGARGGCGHGHGHPDRPISGMLSDVETLTTPLVQQMDCLRPLADDFHTAYCCKSLLIYGYFVGHFPFADLFMAVVGLSVAAIPEGLPAVLTITLAVGVQAMARRNAIRPPFARDRDARLGLGDLLRQDWYAHAQRDDGGHAGSG